MAKYTVCRRCGLEGMWTEPIASITFYAAHTQQRQTIELQQEFRICSSCGSAEDVVRSFVRGVRIEFVWKAVKIHFKGGKVWDYELPEQPKPRSGIWTPGIDL